MQLERKRIDQAQADHSEWEDNAQQQLFTASRLSAATSPTSICFVRTFLPRCAAPRRSWNVTETAHVLGNDIATAKPGSSSLWPEAVGTGGSPA